MGKKILMVLVLSVAMVFAASPAFSQDKVYVNGIDANFPPFAFVDKNGVPDGFDVKALDWIAKDQGFKVKHQPMDWDGIIPSLNAKKIDIIASGMSINDKRKEQVNFSIPYWKIQQVLVAKKDSTLTVDQLLDKGNKVGVQRGTTEAKWIEENLIKKGMKKFSLVYYDSAPLAVEDVVAAGCAGRTLRGELRLDRVSATQDSFFPSPPYSPSPSLCWERGNKGVRV